ncbi:hypothetical protein [Ferruginibacter sp.]|nr:hypothetical protein [Ferruginibacter sp.]
MKNLVFLLFAVTVAFSSYAQTEIKKEYYPDGKIKSETPYVDGKKNGIEKSYYESGKTHWETPYLNDKLNGIIKGYSLNGLLRTESPYVDGKKSGITKRYYENGNIEMTINDSTKEIKFYYENGNIHFEYLNNIDYLDSKGKEYSLDGTLINSSARENKKNGECKEGDCINGYGRFVYTDGKSFTGFWKNGKREGKGYTYEKGMIVNGYWKNDEMITDGCFSGDCKNGYGSYDNGERTTYTGQWKDGKYNGEGTERFQRYQTDITTYTGQWVDGKKHGNGQLTRSTYNTNYRKWEDDTYRGKWEYNKFVEGKRILSDGSSYTGSFDGFYPFGECINTLSNGYYMKAKFANYTSHSKEKYYNNNNIEITETEYNAMNSSLMRATAAIPQCISGDCQNGYGITKYQNGDRYFGYSVNGNKEGLGFIWYADKVTKEYVSLTSLATETVTTLGGVSYGVWENGIQTKSFDRETFYEILKNNPYYGGLWGYDNLGARERAEGVVLAQKEKAENEAAMARYYNEKMKNVSFSSGGSPGSSNSSSGNGTGTTKMPDIIYKTVGGSGTTIYTHKQ